MYTTLAIVRHRLRSESPSYVSAALSFTSATKTIADTGNGLAAFKTGDVIVVSGSSDNDGRYTVAAGGSAASIVTTEALTDEDAGETITVYTANDVEDDQLIESAIEAASAWIDNWCGRSFESEDDVRYFEAAEPGFAFTDDIISVSALEVDSDGDWTWSEEIVSDYFELWPANDVPKTAIQLHPNTDVWFPRGDRAIKVTGTFGYESVPSEVSEACAMLAEQIYKRKDSIFGVEGASGFIQRNFGSFDNDTEIKQLLAGQRRLF